MLKKSVPVAPGMMAPMMIGAMMIVAMMSLTPLHAQNIAWRIDSQRSTARVFLSSAKNPDGAVNVGSARSRGVIHDDAGGSTAPNFNFTIYPADNDATQSKQDQSGNDSDYAEIHFKSTSVVPVNANDFRVTGDLTVTHVERVATTLTPKEAHASAVYSPAVTESVTKPVVFQFHRVSPAGERSRRGDKAEWSASSTTMAEDFPALMNAASTMSRQTSAPDGSSTTPSTLNKDCSGEACTETSRVAKNQIRMQLDLQVSRIDAANSPRSGE